MEVKNKIKVWCERNKKKIIIVGTVVVGSVCGYGLIKHKKEGVRILDAISDVKFIAPVDTTVEIFEFGKDAVPEILTDGVKKLIKDSDTPIEFDFEDVEKILMILGKE